MLKRRSAGQTIANKFVPVVGGSAFKNKGVQYLLDASSIICPSPIDIPPAKGMDPDTDEPMEVGRPTTTASSARSRSSSGPIRSSASSFSSASTPAQLPRATRFTIRAPTSASASRRLVQMQADKREDIETLLLRRHRRHRRHQGRHHRRHALRRGSSTSGSSRRPSPSRSSRWRSSRRPRPTRKRWAPRSQRLVGRRSDPPRLHRRGHRPDHHRRHGRAAPRNHPRPHEPRVQGRDANAGKPQIAYRETITKAARRRGQVHPAVGRPRPVRPRRRRRSSRSERGKGIGHRKQDRRRHHPEGIHSRRSRRASRKRCSTACVAGYPVVDVVVDIVDGSLPRGRLQRTRVQDGRHLRVQGRDEEGKPDPARADHEGRESRPRRSTRATSSATSTAAAARS